MVGNIVDNYTSKKYVDNNVTTKDIYIGRELKKLRNIYRDDNGEVRKLRAFELAEMVGYQQSTISNFENGNKRIPEKLIPELERIFKLPSGYFNSKFNDNYEYNSNGIKASESDTNYYENEMIKQQLIKIMDSLSECVREKDFDNMTEKIDEAKKNIKNIK